MDSSAAKDTASNSRKAPDLLMSPEIESEIESWHVTGVPPFPELLHCPQNGWHGLSRTDLRLIHHITGLSIDLHRRGFSNCTTWARLMPNFLVVALSNDYVMSSILALSAVHLAWITRNKDTKYLAHRHRETAIKGLHKAIGTFSNDNSEAILAASTLLSWQTTEWQSWASLQKGITTVLSTMHPVWKQKSEIAQFLESQRYLGCTNSPAMSGFQFQEKNLASVDRTITALENAQEQVLHSHQEHYCRIGELLDFLRHFRKNLPKQTPQEAFECVQPLRQWLFWLPPAMLRGGETDISALAILSQFFATAVTLDAVFPDLGGAYLGPLSMGPIEDIYRIIAARNTTDPFNPELQLALALMDLPQQAVAQYKSRLYLSQRSSIDYTSPPPPSPYAPVQDFQAASSSSPSTSPSFTPYTPPLHSPPEVGVATSPFEFVDYVTAPTQALYPPSPGLLSESCEDVSDFSSAYPDDVLCSGGLSRTNDTLGMIFGYYPPPETNRDLLAPESNWA